MTKTLAIFAAVFALSAAPAFAATSSAPPAGPYKLDAKGKCHAANGQFAKQSLCSAAASSAKPAPTKCKDPKTKKFVKCGTPGAVPA